MIHIPNESQLYAGVPSNIFISIYLDFLSEYESFLLMIWRFEDFEKFLRVLLKTCVPNDAMTSCTGSTVESVKPNKNLCRRRLSSCIQILLNNLHEWLQIILKKSHLIFFFVGFVIVKRTWGHLNWHNLQVHFFVSTSYVANRKFVVLNEKIFVFFQRNKPQCKTYNQTLVWRQGLAKNYLLHLQRQEIPVFGNKESLSWKELWLSHVGITSGSFSLTMVCDKWWRQEHCYCSNWVCCGQHNFYK